MKNSTVHGNDLLIQQAVSSMVREMIRFQVVQLFMSRKHGALANLHKLQSHKITWVKPLGAPMAHLYVELVLPVMEQEIKMMPKQMVSVLMFHSMQCSQE